jgi:hypothetical protein
MGEPKSQSDHFIVSCVKRGYYATPDGRVFDWKCKEIVGTPLPAYGHLRMTVYADGVAERSWGSVLKHRFIAYFFLGDEIFNHRLIRHLNGVPTDNRIENLKPGSYEENRADIPFEKISGPAKKNAHIMIERNRKISNDEILEMRSIYKAGGISYKSLAELYDISTMTAYRAVVKQSWKDV